MPSLTEMFNTMHRDRINDAAQIVLWLQEWIDKNYESGDWDPGIYQTRQRASFTYCGIMLEISIDDICLWHSESDSEDEFNFESCRDKFIKHVETYRPFLK